MSQENDDIMAALKHRFEQLERKWRYERDEAIRKQAPLEYRIGVLTGERDELARQLTQLSALARAVCERMAGDDNNVTPDTAGALRALERAVREE